MCPPRALGVFSPLPATAARCRLAKPRELLAKLLVVFKEAGEVGAAAPIAKRITDYVRSLVDAQMPAPLLPHDEWAMEEWTAERVAALKALVKSRGPMGTVGGYRGVRGLGEVGLIWKGVALRIASLPQ